MKNSYKMGGKKEKKNGGSLVMMLGGSGSSAHFQIWKHLHFLMKNSYKVHQKIEKVVSMVRGCFSGMSIHVQKR